MKKNITLTIWVSFLILVMFGFLVPKTFVSNNTHIDKWFHFGAFATLTALTYMAFMQLSKKYQALMVIALVILGMTLENLQRFIPHRGFSYYDMYANFLGIFVGFFLIKILTKKGR